MSYALAPSGHSSNHQSAVDLKKELPRAAIAASKFVKAVPI
jgi:hypothetical protein